jgi:hypothetical protein
MKKTTTNIINYNFLNQQYKDVYTLQEVQKVMLSFQIDSNRKNKHLSKSMLLSLSLYLFICLTDIYIIKVERQNYGIPPYQCCIK